MAGLVLWLLALPVAALVVAALMAIYHYNRFQTLENRCEESWSNVETELRRRHELIPNLTRTVQGYAAHEKAVLADITEARALATQEGLTPTEAGRVEGRLARRVTRLLAVAEAYPELKASRNFLQLQEELVVTEDRIQAARRFYNANVRDHRDATRQFPGNLFASWFKPAPQAFFELEA